MKAYKAILMITIVFCVAVAISSPVVSGEVTYTYEDVLDEGDGIQINNYFIEFEEIVVETEEIEENNETNEENNETTNETIEHYSIIINCYKLEDAETRDLEKLEEGLEIDEGDSYSLDDDLTMTINEIDEGEIGVTLESKFQIWDDDYYPRIVEDGDAEEDFIFPPRVDIYDVEINVEEERDIEGFSENTVETGEEFTIEFKIRNDGTGLAKDFEMGLNVPEGFNIEDRPDPIDIPCKISDESNTATIEFTISAPDSIDGDFESFEISISEEDIEYFDAVGSDRDTELPEVEVGIDESYDICVYRRIPSLSAEVTSDTIERGETAELLLTLTNEEDAIGNVENIEISAEFDEDIMEVDIDPRFPPDLSPGNSRDVEAEVEFDFMKDVVGSHTIQFNIDYEDEDGESYTKTVESEVEVEEESVLAVELKEAPMIPTVQVRDHGTIEIIIVNDGDSPVEHIGVELLDGEGYRVEEGEESISHLSDGDLEELEFKIAALEVGEHEINFRITSPATGEQIETFDLNITEREEDVLQLDAEDISVDEDEEGAVEISIKNDGMVPLDGVEVELQTGYGYEILENLDEVGTLEGGEEVTVEGLVEGTEPGEHTIEVLLQSEETEDATYSISLTVIEDDSILNQIISGFSNIGSTIANLEFNPVYLVPIAIIAGLSGWIIWRKRQFTYK